MSNKKAKVVTLQMLLDKGACSSQVELFKKHFPKKGEAKVTKALCLKVASIFDFDWAAEALLPAPLLAEYQSKKALLFCELYNS